MQRYIEKLDRSFDSLNHYFYCMSKKYKTDARIHKIVTTLFFSVVVLSAVAQSYRPPVFTDKNRSEKIAASYTRLDSLFSKYAAEKHFPSISYGLVVDGRLVHSFYSGTINLEKNIAASALSDYHIASMTKSFTAMAILKLRDEGKLSLDDPIEKYIPEAKGMKTVTTDAPLITIRHLLTHNAGFPEDNPWGDRQLGRSDAYLDSLYAKGISFSTTPGTGYEYSNLGFATLGLIIKKASGKRYQDYITENILKPLGMTETYWDYDDVPKNQLVIGYRYVDGKFIAQPLLHSGAFGAMGGLITTIGDFAKYMSFHLSAWPHDGADNGPVKRSSLREMQHAWNFSRVWTGEKNAKGKDCDIMDSYCYGLHEYLDCDGLRIITHSGGLPGFGSQWRILPDYGIGMVVFGNLTYAPMGTPLTAAIDSLLNWAQLEPRVLPASRILEKRKQQIVALLPSWKNAEQSGIFAENFFEDYFITQLQKQSAEAFQKAGKIVSVSDVVATNQLRGYFIVKGEKANIKIWFSLSPEPDPKIQAFKMEVI
jgi:CubicO group peptidase (beta-lactamase class C family)